MKIQRIIFSLPALIVLFLILFFLSSYIYQFTRIHFVPSNITKFIDEHQSRKLVFLDSIWDHRFDYRRKGYGHLRCLSYESDQTITRSFSAFVDTTMSKIIKPHILEELTGECNDKHIASSSSVEISDSLQISNEAEYFNKMVRLKESFGLYRSWSWCGKSAVYYFPNVELYYKYPEDKIPKDEGYHMKRINIDSNWVVINTM